MSSVAGDQRLGVTGRVKSKAKRRLNRWLFAGELWCRVEMNRHIDAYLETLDKPSLDAVEISGWGGRANGWRTFDRLKYPQFDLCKSTPARQYDVVLCEQVLEHVVDPVAAVKTLFALTKPGGHVIVDTPFMLRIHEAPGDYWRFTKDGMRILLSSAGFEDIKTFSWGNRACIKADMFRIAPYRILKRHLGGHWRAYQPWHSLSNESSFPIVIWAYAKRPA
ncbi:MAG TPA: methyltransferase domain-containing protein [Acidimicrobiales bacterium]|nr:methyltransferase domain-containing protein [Acidimicrobiales bacterium]